MPIFCTSVQAGRRLGVLVDLVKKRQQAYRAYIVHVRTTENEHFYVDFCRSIEHLFILLYTVAVDDDRRHRDGIVVHERK